MREVRGEQKAARKAPRQLRPSRLRRRGYANGGRRRGRHHLLYSSDSECPASVLLAYWLPLDGIVTRSTQVTRSPARRKMARAARLRSPARRYRARPAARTRPEPTSRWTCTPRSARKGSGPARRSLRSTRGAMRKTPRKGARLPSSIRPQPTGVGRTLAVPWRRTLARSCPSQPALYRRPDSRLATRLRGARFAAVDPLQSTCRGDRFAPTYEMTAACRYFAARGFVAITMVYRLDNRQTGGALAPANWSAIGSPLPKLGWKGGFLPAPQSIWPAVCE